MRLTDDTRKRVGRVFPDDEAEVLKILEHECGATLPQVRADDPRWERLVERVRFAVLRLSGGRIQALDDAIRLAHRDWRDVLTEAGFGEVDAHLKWNP